MTSQVPVFWLCALGQVTSPLCALIPSIKWGWPSPTGSSKDPTGYRKGGVTRAQHAAGRPGAPVSRSDPGRLRDSQGAAPRLSLPKCTVTGSAGSDSGLRPWPPEESRRVGSVLNDKQSWPTPAASGLPRRCGRPVLINTRAQPAGSAQGRCRRVSGLRPEARSLLGVGGGGREPGSDGGGGGCVPWEGAGAWGLCRRPSSNPTGGRGLTVPGPVDGG